MDNIISENHIKKILQISIRVVNSRYQRSVSGSGARSCKASCARMTRQCKSSLSGSSDNAFSMCATACFGD